MRLSAFAYITDGGDRMANGSILIKDTTREERERIVREGLGCGGCAGCDGCDVRGGGSTEEIYRPYIDGRKELAEINAEWHRGTVK